jgi:hypothetical protein
MNTLAYQGGALSKPPIAATLNGGRSGGRPSLKLNYIPRFRQFIP